MPSSGVPLQTDFALRINKKPVGIPLKCEFAYENRVGLIHLPTSDTEDNLS